jgi:uncharacterized membrane protein
MQATVIQRKLILFITLLLLMLITGLFWGTWFSLSRSIDNFSASEFINIGKTIIKNVANPMRVIMPLCILLMAVSLWLHPDKRSVTFYLILTSFVLLIVTLIITVGIEVPMDNQIKTWSPETVPSDWTAIRSRWQLFHTMRTFTSLASFTLFTAASFETFKG